MAISDGTCARENAVKNTNVNGGGKPSKWRVSFTYYYYYYRGKIEMSLGRHIDIILLRRRWVIYFGKTTTSRPNNYTICPLLLSSDIIMYITRVL